MKIYVGDVIKNAVYDEKQVIPIIKLAKQIRLSRTQFYQIINNPEMDPDYIIKIGRAINKDFSKILPEIKDHEYEILNEPIVHYEREDKSLEELIQLQRKYIRALEDIIELKKQLRVYEINKNNSSN